MQKTVLILGASGRFGRHAASAFSWADWNVIKFDRATDKLPDAAWGAEVIVNAWNPAYPNWARDVPKLTEQVIRTARETGATVLIPGNVYNYGTDMPARLTEDTPHNASGSLGKIREDMEQAYKDAGVQTIVLRAGDFIDTQASGNWYDMILMSKLKKGVMQYPGDLDTAHAWAFLPDLAEAAVGLAEMRSALPRFTRVNFPGYTLTGRELHAGIERVLGSRVKLKTMAWWPIRLAQVVWPVGRYLLQMRYLWNTPHSLSGEKLGELLPDFKQTDLDDALEASLPEDIDPNGVMTGAIGVQGPAVNLPPRHLELS